RFDQPVQDGVGVDLEHPRRGADTSPLGQAGQDAHDTFHRRLFAVEERTVRFQKVPLTRGTVELPPGATAGMTVGPQIVQPQPTAIVTIGVGTKMHRGVHGTRPSVRWGYGIRPSRRGWSPCPDLLLTQGTVGLARQARERFGLGGRLTLRPDGLGWCLGSFTGWARPEVRQHEAQPEQDQDHQLIVNEVRNHRIAPLHDGVGGPFYPVFKPSELSAAVGYTTEQDHRAVKRMTRPMVGFKAFDSA